MPPKKRAADSADPPQPTSSKDPAEETSEKKKSGAVALRKLAAHPTTAIMVREALTALDSRKGVSSQAIQSFIKQKYPSVDVVRLKHLVRRALIRGMETGTLVRPANSTVTTGALGRFRLAPKVKGPKSKSENADPNAQKAPKAAKDGVKPPEEAGAIKKKKSAKGEIKSTENVMPAEKSDADAAPSKVAPAKKPKAKKAEVKVSGEENSNLTKTGATKRSREPKMGKVQSKAAKAGGDAPVPKTTGKRGKKTE